MTSTDSFHQGASPAGRFSFSRELDIGKTELALHKKNRPPPLFQLQPKFSQTWRLIRDFLTAHRSPLNAKNITFYQYQSQPGGRDLFPRRRTFSKAGLRGD
ncbi:MAG: hypothetical protein V4710_15150 [Verrucomicrobiota bacterium]